MTKSEVVAPIFFPRGVADLDEEIAYVANYQAEIEAIDLQSGELRWKSGAALRPLHIFQHKLVAQRPHLENAHALEVLLLNPAASGEVVLVSEPLVFPDWVYTGGDNATSLAIRAFLRQDELLLGWYSQKGYEGGAPPPNYVLEETTRSADGLFRVNLHNGDVAALDAPLDALPVVEKLAHYTSVPYFQDGRWHENAWIIDDEIAALALEKVNEQQTLFLQTWDLASGDARRKVELARDASHQISLTLDGRYLLVLSHSREGLWQIFELPDGKAIAQLPYNEEAQSIAIYDGRAYMLTHSGSLNAQRHLLVCQELAGGSVLWEHPLDKPALDERSRSLPPPLPP